MKTNKIIQTRPHQATIPELFKDMMEEESVKDGQQRGIFFDTSGKCRCEIVSATAQYPYLFKTKAGTPKTWGEFQVFRP